VAAQLLDVNSNFSSVGESAIDKSYLPHDPHLTLHLPPKKDKIDVNFNPDDHNIYKKSCIVPLFKVIIPLTTN